MTVNYSFDLEDDDILDDTFRSIPENDLLSYSISRPASEHPKNNYEFSDLQAAGPSDALEHSNIDTINASKSRKNSLSFLFKSKESVSTKEKGFSFSEICSPNTSVIVDNSTKINSRFVPGVTPKVKKLKLPGPAGFYFENDAQHFSPIDSEHEITEGKTAYIEIQNITNSQFFSEDLHLSSWQNLQAEVSSFHNLLSAAKYYSICRVFHETSKKKLPKHLVIPVLCVIIKKFNAEESSLVFMDDTGEISGKIDKEVLDNYKDAIQERTALILKRVTCICNILILKKQNVVSIYREDGSVKHVQDLNSILDIEEPLKPMNCQCPGTPVEQTVRRLSFSKVCNSTPVLMKKTLNASHKTQKKVPSSCSSAKSLKESSCKVKSINASPRPQIPIGKGKVLNILESMLDVSRNNFSSGSSISTSSSIKTTGETLKSVANVEFNYSASCSNEIMSNILNTEKDSNNSKSRHKADTVNNPSFSETTLEDLFCEDADDFDNILCSLDEDSFLQEM